MRFDGLEEFLRSQFQDQDETELDPAMQESKGISRRNLLQGGFVTGVAASNLFEEANAQTVEESIAQQPQDTPIGPPWWPSRWGAEDEAGASNWITPEKVLAATKLIRTGKIYELGRVAEGAMPLFGQRGFLLRMVGSPAGGPLGDNKIVWNDEFLSTEIGQVATALDGLGHIGCQTGKDGDLSEMRFYNGFTQHEIASPQGLKKLGIEKVKPFFTRGIVIDMVAVKGRMLNKGEEITLADLRSALSRQKIAESSFQPGDAIFFHTGWGQLWMKDNQKFNDGEPGIGVEVARWAVEKQLSLVGADNWAVEVIPNPNSQIVFPVHHELITKNGIFLQEGMDFTELIADRVFEFAYILTPIRFKGATGSITRPIAIA